MSSSAWGNSWGEAWGDSWGAIEREYFGIGHYLEELAAQKRLEKIIKRPYRPNIRPIDVPPVPYGPTPSIVPSQSPPLGVLSDPALLAQLQAQQAALAQQSEQDDEDEMIMLLLAA